MGQTSAIIWRPQTKLLIVGLLSSTRRKPNWSYVTGDRSGDFLFSPLYRAGYASQPDAITSDDGMELMDAYITAPVGVLLPKQTNGTGAKDMQNI